jgi:hypothetical protein
MALQQVNNNPSILKNIQLVSRWNDTKGDRVRATLVITEMLCDGVAAFIGPEGSCFVESIVSQSRNVPMISYVSTRWIYWLQESITNVYLTLRVHNTVRKDSIILLLRRHIGNWPRGPAVSMRSKLLVTHKKLGQFPLLTVYVAPV